jgi:hypothetical protein
MSLQLPRDIELSIIKKFDIDTRIKTNIIHRLQVPNDLSQKLNSLNLLRKLSFELRSRNETSHMVTLQFYPGKFYQCYYDETEHDYLWYFVDTNNTTTHYRYPYLLTIYPPKSQRMSSL